MKIIRNTGTERVIDLIRPQLGGAQQLDLVTRSLALGILTAILAQHGLDNVRSL